MTKRTSEKSRCPPSGAHRRSCGRRSSRSLLSTTLQRKPAVGASTGALPWTRSSSGLGPAVVVEHPKPTEESPQNLCLAKGYDNRPTRELAEGRNYIPHIRRIGEERLHEAGEKRHPARRWVVECRLG